MRIALALALALTACGTGARTFEEPVSLGGVEVSPDVLNRGELVYMSRCRRCHGQQGRGDGPHSMSMEPRPADLTTGRYPRATGDPDALPSDEDLRRVLEQGVEGTPMGSQDLDEAELEAVLQYTKTLAPVWRDPP